MGKFIVLSTPTLLDIPVDRILDGSYTKTEEGRLITTIAWDGTTLAGDTLGVIGDCLRVWSRKIFCLTDGRLFGGSGKYDQVLAVRDWLEYGGDKPTVDAFAGILIDQRSQCYRLEESLICMPIAEAFHAVGSGRDFAMAAMALGENAFGAVTLASRFDVFTGTCIQSMRVGDDDGAVETREIPPLHTHSLVPCAQRKEGRDEWQTDRPT